MDQAPSEHGSRHASEIYEVRVHGHIGPRWAARLEVLSLTQDNDGSSTLRVAVVDQAALHGLLQKVRDLGLPLISVMPAANDPA